MTNLAAMVQDAQPPAFVCSWLDLNHGRSENGWPGCCYQVVGD